MVWISCGATAHPLAADGMPFEQQINLFITNLSASQFSEYVSEPSLPRTTIHDFMYTSSFAIPNSRSRPSTDSRQALSYVVLRFVEQPYFNKGDRTVGTMEVKAAPVRYMDHRPVCDFAGNHRRALCGAAPDHCPFFLRQILIEFKTNVWHWCSSLRDAFCIFLKAPALPAAVGSVYLHQNLEAVRAVLRIFKRLAYFGKREYF
jgi:hypothetical protein